MIKIYQTLADEAAKVLRLNEVKKSALTFLLESTNILEQVNKDVKGIIAEKFEDLMQQQEKDGESGKTCSKRKAAGQIQHRHHKLRRFEFLGFPFHQRRVFY